MDEIERLFNNIVKLFNSVNIYKKKISKNWFPFTQKSSKCLQSFDLNYYNSSSMIHVTTSQILYSAKTKPVDDVCRKSLKTKVALINAEIISLCKRRRIWCPLCCTHCIWCAHCFFCMFFFFSMYSWNWSFDVMETKVLDIFYILNQGPIYEMQHCFLFIFYQFNETLNFLIYFKVI